MYIVRHDCVVANSTRMSLTFTFH